MESLGEIPCIGLTDKTYQVARALTFVPCGVHHVDRISLAIKILVQAAILFGPT
jgi:hypothetical protein